MSFKILVVIVILNAIATIALFAHSRANTNSNPTNHPSRTTDFGISSVEPRVSQEVFG
jgi:hypothetical protein